MLIIKENDRVYVVASTYEICVYGRIEQCMLTENIPMFKAKGSKAIIAADANIKVDDLRYVRLPMPKELNLTELMNKTMPRVKDVWRSMGRDDEDGQFPDLIIAQGNKAFVYRYGDVITEVVEEEATGMFDGPLRYALKLTRGMPLAERLQKVYKSIETLSAEKMFPLFVIDTVSKKVKMVKEAKR